MPPAYSKGSPSIQHPHSGPHDNGISPQKSIKRLLKVRKAIHVSWGKIISDEGCPLYSGDNFTDHHVWSVETRGINVPSFRSLLCTQYYRAQQRDSMDIDLCTNRARVQDWFLLWSGMSLMVLWYSIKWMESADIHWGLDAQTLGSGVVYEAFSSWNMASNSHCGLYTGGALGRLVAPGDINYDTG